MRGSLPGDFSEGLASACDSDSFLRCGFIDHNGRFLIPPQFYEAHPFSDGLARVTTAEESGTTGYIDHQGHFVIPPHLIEGADFSDGLAAAIIDGPCKLVQGERCTVKYVPVSSNANFDCRSVFIDKTGRPVSDLRFDRSLPFSEGRAAVLIDRKWGFADKSGHIVISPQFVSAGQFSEGVARVSLPDKNGYIDTSGQFVIVLESGFGSEFSNGRAVITRRAHGQQTCWFIDHTGKPAFPGTFADAGPFGHGLAPVRRADGTFAWIDTSGKTVFTYKVK
jgi:hypothetical protein